MHILNKTIRFIDRFTDYVTLAFFSFFILLGAYAVYDSFMLYEEATDNSIMMLKPQYEKGGEENVSEITKDMVAWLTIYDTSIDYPVMQGRNNTEYLNKNPFGEYSLAGSIFLDSRNAPGFTDYYNLIYGHHMDNSLMFGALDKYYKKGYLDDHKYAELIVEKEKYKIRFFAVLETNATNQAIFEPTENDSETMPYIMENSIYLNEEDIPKRNEKLIAISTCKYPSSAKRLIVAGALYNEGSLSDKGEKK